jgi:hypothetical protein
VHFSLLLPVCSLLTVGLDRLISHDGSMYGILMLTWLGYFDGKCYHIWHTWILWVIMCLKAFPWK